jgi:hypothetical protein
MNHRSFCCCKTLAAQAVGSLLVRAGNTLFVDAVYGDNDNAQRNTQNRPYRTVQAAINAAQSADLISVGPGDFDEALVMRDDLSSLVIRGAGITATRIGNSAGDPALLVRPQTPQLNQLVLADLGLVKVAGAASVLRVDGTAVVSPDSSLQASLILLNILLLNGGVEATIDCACIARLSTDFVYAVGGPVVLREVAAGQIQRLSASDVSIRYSEAQPRPGQSRDGLLFQSLVANQVDIEDQAKASFDAACQVATLNLGGHGTPLQVGPTLSPEITFRGAVETGPVILMGPAAGPNNTFLDFSTAKISGVNCDSQGPAETYALNLRESSLPMGQSVSVNGGASAWAVDAMGSNLAPAATLFQPGAGSTLQRFKQGAVVQLASNPEDFTLGPGGSLPSVPPFNTTPDVQAAPTGPVASPVAAQMLSPGAVRVWGTVGDEIALQFFGVD